MIEVRLFKMLWGRFYGSKVSKFSLVSSTNDVFCENLQTKEKEERERKKERKETNTEKKS